MRRNNEWWPGIHQPLITETDWDAAHKGHVPGRRRGTDLLSGKVTCGICGRRMSVQQNGKGQRTYRCWHRGNGCDQPSRSNKGLERAMGLGLLCSEPIREAIRRHLESLGSASRQAARTSGPGADARLTKLRRHRDKLLGLYLSENITSDQFGERQAAITAEIETLEAETNQIATHQLRADDLTQRFEAVIALLDRIGIEDLWNAATSQERRTLLDELGAAVTIHPDRLQVQVHGAPPLNVAYREVGLKDSENVGVGGGT